MATVKRILGNYQITTLDASAVISLNTSSVDISGNITANNITVANTVSFPTANISANNITSNSITSTGNFITTGVFIGDGSGLTNIPTGVASGNRIQNGTSKVDMPNLSGNIEMNVGGVANVMLLTTTGATVAGNVDAATINTGNILTDNYYFANGVPFVSGGTVKFDAQSTEPVAPDPGDFWFNTNNGIVYQYVDDGDSEQWVDITGIATPPATTSTVANTVVQRDTNGSITANNITANSMVSSGAISATFFVGNGSLLTGIATTPTEIVSGTSTVTFASPSGTIIANVAGNTVASFSSLGFTVGNIINQNPNGVGTIGSPGGYFNRIYATSTSALYADLAEIYEADSDYEPGTVLIFHGSKDLTTTTIDHDPRVAGVVSTAPAYVMNSGANGLQLALTGRVPCRVQGPVNKGDVLVTSTQAGVAQAIDNNFWVPGCTLGKSLETIEDDSIQTIEIAVGRY
jgi:hypothetical protein